MLLPALCCNSDKFCDKESGVRKVVLRGSIRNVVMAQQLIMDLVWEEMETAIGVMQFMIPDEVKRMTDTHTNLMDAIATCRAWNTLLCPPTLARALAPSLYLSALSRMKTAM